MDYRILELFIKENDAWEDMIRRQKMEMPVLDAMISNIVADKKDERRPLEGLPVPPSGNAKSQLSMVELEKELMKQQQYLSSERKRKSSDPYSIDTLNSQTFSGAGSRTLKRILWNLNATI